MITFSSLIRAARELEGYRLIPLRAEVMEDTAAKCNCGRCYCCKMARFVWRIRKVDSKREEVERKEIEKSGRNPLTGYVPSGKVGA